MPLSIADRIKAKQADILASRRARAPVPAPAQTPPAAPQKPQPLPPSAQAEKPAQAPDHHAKPATRRTGKKQPISNDTGETAPSSVDFAVLWGLFGLPEDHPAAVREIVGPRLEGMLEGLLEGASKPGVQGASDRAVLFKMLGARWAQPAGRGGDLNAAAAAQIGDRIARAIARREEAMRQGLVTIDMRLEPEPAPVLPISGQAQMLVEQVRVPTVEKPAIGRAPGASKEGDRRRVEASSVEDLLGAW